MDSSPAVSRPIFLRAQSDIAVWEALEHAVLEVRRAVVEQPAGNDADRDFDGWIRDVLIPRALARQERELSPGVHLPPSAAQVLFSAMRGYAELDPLLLDPQVTEIIVDGPDQEVYVERHGVLEGTGQSLSRERIMYLAERMGAEQGQLISTAHPVQEIRLPMARVTAIHDRLAPRGPSLVIRLRGRHHLEIGDLIANGTVSQAFWGALSGAFRGGANIIVSGEVSSGKTTLVEVLLASLPADRRIVTVEDPIEFDLPRKRLQQLEVRQANADGRGGFDQRELVRLSLRMRPDHLIVGEVRDGSAWDMVDAMSLGHNGSVTTIHAASVPKAMIRLENLALRAEDVPALPAVRRAIEEAVNLVVQISRVPAMRDGAPIIRRVVTEIAELTDLAQSDNNNVYQLSTLASFENGALKRTGNALSDSLSARLRANGVEPGFGGPVASL